MAFTETDSDTRGKMFKFCATLESAPRIDAMIDLSSTEEEIAVVPDVFDQDVYLLNTPAGNHRPSDRRRNTQSDGRVSTEKVSKVGAENSGTA
jgi:hypothetical protein